MKVFIKIFILLIAIWIVIFLFNLFMMSNHTKPIVIFDTFTYEYEGYNYTEYTSLGYKVIMKEKGWLKESKLAFIWTENIPNMKFIVRDETEGDCGKAFEPFYEDEHYEYYFSCDKDIFIEIDKEKYPVKDALDKKLITIEELKEFIDVEEKRKILYSFELNNSSCQAFTEDVNQLKMLNTNLYTYCLDEVNIYINSKYYTFQEVFNDKITLDSLTLEMKEIGNYDNGAKMYTDFYANILICPNERIVIGNSDMVYYDFMCN